jgi:hypothetical protein
MYKLCSVMSELRLAAHLDTLYVVHNCIIYSIVIATGFPSMRSLRKCLIQVARERRERRSTTGEALV